MDSLGGLLLISETFDIRAHAEVLLGPITWESANLGYCQCPGKHLHTGQSKRRDCRVLLDRVPTVHCFHQSCAGEIQRINGNLRAENPERLRLPPEEAKRWATAQAERQRLNLRAKSSVPQMLRSYSWPLTDIILSSPWELSDNNERDVHLLCMLKVMYEVIDGNSLIWIGDKTHSGAAYRSCFRTRNQWIELIKRGTVPDGPLVCPSVFRAGTFERKNENVAETPYLIVESDTLSKDQVGAIFRWLVQTGLHLHAVVDTAGKSLHGWFDYPDQDNLDDLKIILRALGCDPKLFSPSQPVRLPGGLRDGKIQKLVYFDGPNLMR